MRSPIYILAEVLELDVEEVHMNSAIGALPNWDSLNHVVIIAQIEEEYNLKINDEDLMNYGNLEALNDLYNRVLSKN